MAWSFNGLSIKEMTDPMIRGAMDELRAELGCRGQQVMWREDHSVTPVERIAVHCETRIEWHRDHQRNK